MKTLKELFETVDPFAKKISLNLIKEIDQKVRDLEVAVDEGGIADNIRKDNMKHLTTLVGALNKIKKNVLKR